MAYDIVIGRTDEEKKEFGTKGTVFIGKTYVKVGPYTSLSNNLFLDVANPHVIMISGKRGCLSGDTKIFTSHGFKEIKDFDSFHDKILSFNKEKRECEWENAKLLRYQIKNEKLVKVEFKDGRTIATTKEHPLLLEYGKYLFWREANKLKEKDKIVCVTEVPEVKNDAESLRIARLLGFILADGTMGLRKGRFKDGRGYWYNGTKARIRIFNACEEVLSIAKEDLEKEFNITAKRYKREDCNCEVVETKHQKILNKFNELGVPIGDKSGIIRVPQIVFASSNKFKANFISALFCCDGYVPADGRSLDYSSKSKGFVSDLQLLLKHFNIESVIRKRISKCNGKSFESYRLFITDYNSIENFKKRIGLFSKFKEDRLKKHKFGLVKRRKNTRYISDVLNCPKIKSISELEGIEEVFDLYVPKNHSFIANGIISHNSGKSYSASVIAEEMSRLPQEVKKNLSVLFFDTLGVFWTMKFPNTRQEDLLNEWGLQPEGLPIEIYTPKGFFKKYKEAGIPTDHSFTIKTSELTPADWASVFETKLNDPIGIIIERIIGSLQETKKDYSIHDIINLIEIDTRSKKEDRDAVINRFLAADKWGLFEKYGTQIDELVKPGGVTVLDISAYTEMSGAWSIKALVIGLISRKLLLERIEQRKKEELSSMESLGRFFVEEKELERPMVWIMIDEAHEFIGRTGETPATSALVQLLREGRQPGISMVLVTQQPGEIHKDVLTQSDIVLSHRLTAQVDIEALNSMMQTYLLADLQTYINNLPALPGSAIILDDKAERIYPMRIHPKRSWHGGEAPSALKVKKKFELGL